MKATTLSNIVTVFSPIEVFHSAPPADDYTPRQLLDIRRRRNGDFELHINFLGHSSGFSANCWVRNLDSMSRETLTGLVAKFHFYLRKLVVTDQKIKLDGYIKERLDALEEFVNHVPLSIKVIARLEAHIERTFLRQRQDDHLGGSGRCHIASPSNPFVVKEEYLEHREETNEKESSEAEPTHQEGNNCPPLADIKLEFQAQECLRRISGLKDEKPRQSPARKKTGFSACVNRSLAFQAEPVPKPSQTKRARRAASRNNLSVTGVSFPTVAYLKDILYDPLCLLREAIESGSYISGGELCAKLSKIQEEAQRRFLADYSVKIE